MKVRIAILKSIYGIASPTLAGMVIYWFMPTWYVALVVWMFVGTLVLGLAAMLMEYIEVSETSLVHRNVLGRREIAWKDVTGYMSGDEKRLIKKREVRIDIPWEEITLIDSYDKPFPLGDLRRFRDYDALKEYILNHAVEGK